MCENKTRKLISWRESIKMPLFEYEFYSKLQEGGTRKTKWSCAKQNTDTEIVESIRCSCLNKNIRPKIKKQKQKKIKNKNHTQQNRKEKSNETRTGSFHTPQWLTTI